MNKEYTDIIINKFISEIKEIEFLKGANFGINNIEKDLINLAEKSSPIDRSIHNKVFDKFDTKESIVKLSGKEFTVQKKAILSDDGPILLYKSTNGCVVVYLDFKEHKVYNKNFPMSKYYEYMANFEKKRESFMENPVNEEDAISGDEDFDDTLLDINDLQGIFRNQKKSKQSFNKYKVKDFDFNDGDDFGSIY